MRRGGRVRAAVSWYMLERASTLQCGAHAAAGICTLQHPTACASRRTPPGINHKRSFCAPACSKKKTRCSSSEECSPELNGHAPVLQTRDARIAQTRDARQGTPDAQRRYRAPRGACAGVAG
eukprot:1919296-Prymnesium_polylepis.1